jgi:hypothetical protein
MKKRSQNPGGRAARLVAAAALLVSMGACGGDTTVDPSCPAGQVGTPPNCMDPPVPCVQTTLFQDSGPIPDSTILFDDFSVTEDSRVDFTLDWTDPASQVGFYLVPASTCTLDEFNQRSCSFLIQDEPPNSKPLRQSIPLNAGNYRWMIANFDDDEESVSMQVVQSTGDCPAITGTPPSGSARQDGTELSVQHFAQR